MDTVPVFRITTITQAISHANEFTVEGVFVTNNALGQSAQYQTNIVFEVDDSATSIQKSTLIALQKIVIGGQVIHGWWYDLQSTDK